MHTIIKSLTLDKNQYCDLEKNIHKHSLKIGKKEYPAELCKAWLLVSSVLAIFASHGDKESAQLFYNCLISNNLPKIHILEYKHLIKICICIKIHEPYGQRINSYNTTK